MLNPVVKSIDVLEFNKRYHQSPLTIIDVREPTEWDAGHIPKAIHIPKDSIKSCIQEKCPDFSQPLYLYCKGGVRSLYAAQLLNELGYREVYSVDGGFLAWMEHGFDVMV